MRTWRRFDSLILIGMLNIAHRGYTKDWPGNTLEAVEAAIRLGVDAVEVDVQETGDECFVLAHEAAIEGRAISALGMSELMGLDVGIGCRVATLEEALDICRGEVGVVLELKEVRSLGRFLEVVRGSGEEGRVGVCSFDPGLLKKVRDVGSSLRMGLIVDAPPREPVRVLEELGCEVIGVRAPHITSQLIAEVHASGRMVFGWGVGDATDVERLVVLGWGVGDATDVERLVVLGWGVGDATDVERLVVLGVDGLVSDFPDVVRGVVGEGLS